MRSLHCVTVGSTWRWRKVRAAVLERDGMVCRVPVDPITLRPSDAPNARPHLLPLTTHDRSLRSHAHCDHIVERVHGGTDDPRNLRAACQGCNLQRAATYTNSSRVAPLNTSRSW